jgi:hypothetical protein
MKNAENKEKLLSELLSQNGSFDSGLIIGVSGFARCGKNTLAEILSQYSSHLGLSTKMFSFAYALRQDLNSFCKEKFGISSFTEDTLDKGKIRSILIAYGQSQRALSEGSYWWKKLMPEINSFFSSGGNVAIISDLRFKEYGFDEVDFIRSYANSLIITLTRVCEDGTFVSPAHESESENFPKIASNADLNLTWKTVSKEENSIIFESIPAINTLDRKLKETFK